MILLFMASVSNNRAQDLDRSKPPAPAPSPNVSFPAFQEGTLGNGMKVIVVENHKLPVVTVNLVVRAGSVMDDTLPGLADFTASLLSKGTTHRSATQIAEDADFLGASLNTFSGWDASYVTIGTLTKYLPQMLDLMSDVVLHPTFPDEEVKRLQVLQAADLAQAKADGGYLAGTRMAQVLYGDHPYGRTMTEQSINSMTAQACKNFHDSFYAPNNAFFVVAGDVDADSIAAQLGELFKDWKPVAFVPPAFKPLQPITETRVSIVEKPGAVQSSIRVAQEGVQRSNPDYYALDALNTLLGGYFNSRLNANLRETHGYTYGVRSRFDARRLGGSFYVGCDVRTSVTDSAITEIMNELRRISSEAVPDTELEMMKNYVSGQFPLTIETPQQVANQLQNIELYSLPKDYYATLGAKVRALNSDGLFALAKQYIHPDRLNIVVAGDSKKVAPLLKQIGPEEVTDINGKLISPK